MNTSEQQSNKVRKALPKIKVLVNSAKFIVQGAGGVNGSNAMLAPENQNKGLSFNGIVCM